MITATAESTVPNRELEAGVECSAEGLSRTAVAGHLGLKPRELVEILPRPLALIDLRHRPGPSAISINAYLALPAATFTYSILASAAMLSSR